ncbi:hypothetical protein [Streptomyces roseoverticillatus]|nr:hypothetical protein [Streptomyces roseoverticillatus]
MTDSPDEPTDDVPRWMLVVSAVADVLLTLLKSGGRSRSSGGGDGGDD